MSSKRNAEDMAEDAPKSCKVCILAVICVVMVPCFAAQAGVQIGLLPALAFMIVLCWGAFGVLALGLLLSLLAETSEPPPPPPSRKGRKKRRAT